MGSNELDYYAFLDDIEIYDGMLHLRFDSIQSSKVDLSKDLAGVASDIKKAPSIIYEMSCVVTSFDSYYTIKASRLRLDLWYQIRLGNQGINAKQFMLDENNEGRLVHIESISPLDGRRAETRKLNRVVSLDAFQDTPEAKIKQLLDNPHAGTGDYFAVFNVGQGSCSAILSNQLPILYFDFGGGCNSNAATYPNSFIPCTTNSPPVVLSHWDMDHWISGHKHRNALSLDWITPRQAIGPTHLAFAQKLSSSNKLHIWPQNLPILTTSLGTFYKLPKGTGRNHTGIVFVAEVFQNNRKYILCPGDACYSRINASLFIDVLVATHHGGYMRGNTPPHPNLTPGTIIYSYGQNNSYGHPHHQTMTDCRTAGWSQEIHTMGGHLTIPTMNNLPQSPPCGAGSCSLTISQ